MEICASVVVVSVPAREVVGVVGFVVFAVVGEGALVVVADVELALAAVYSGLGTACNDALR